MAVVLCGQPHADLCPPPPFPPSLVSENRAGKAGTQALAAWLANENISLEQFHAASCDLDLEILLKAIAGNRRLLEQTLTTLNISGNKVGG